MSVDLLDRCLYLFGVIRTGLRFNIGFWNQFLRRHLVLLTWVLLTSGHWIRTTDLLGRLRRFLLHYDVFYFLYRFLLAWWDRNRFSLRNLPGRLFDRLGQWKPVGLNMDSLLNILIELIDLGLVVLVLDVAHNVFHRKQILLSLLLKFDRIIIILHYFIHSFPTFIIISTYKLVKLIFRVNCFLFVILNLLIQIIHVSDQFLIWLDQVVNLVVVIRIVLLNLINFSHKFRSLLCL